MTDPLLHRLPEREFNEQLVSRINRYWAEQGYQSDARLVAPDYASRSTVSHSATWGVRSSLGLQLPPRVS